jgi:hypothetical protein
MSDELDTLKQEMARTEVEPLLPIEKKLIGWSLGLGLGLLTGLFVLNKMFGFL